MPLADCSDLHLEPPSKCSDILHKDCPAFRLMDLKTKSLKGFVDPCADMNVGMCRLS